MFKVGIVGPESTGKSTLGKYFAKRYNAIYISEYAREYIGALKRPYQREDVEHIARKQIEQIQSYKNDEDKVVFFDTELIITKVWFIYKYGQCPTWLQDALEANPMDAYLLCAPDIPFIEDPLRENPHIREELFNVYETEIQATGVPYYIIRHK